MSGSALVPELSTSATTVVTVAVGLAVGKRTVLCTIDCGIDASHVSISTAATSSRARNPSASSQV